MKVVIAGGRKINSYTEVRKAIEESPWFGVISEVVSGDCYGVDKLGELWASANGIPIKKFPAEWNKYGDAAGPIRNKNMLIYVEQMGGLIVIWNGKSKGSRNIIKQAEELGVPVFQRIVKTL